MLLFAEKFVSTDVAKLDELAQLIKGSLDAKEPLGIPISERSFHADKSDGALSLIASKVHEVSKFLYALFVCGQPVQNDLPSLLMMLILRLFGRVKSSEVLSLFEGDLGMCVYFLTESLKDIETTLFSSQLLSSLTAANTIFESTNFDENISLLTNRYRKHVSTLIVALIDAQTVEAYLNVFTITADSDNDKLMYDFATLLENSFRFTCDRQRIFREHIAKHSEIASAVLLPYLIKKKDCLNNTHVSLVLKLLGTLSFNVKAFRPDMLAADDLFLSLAEGAGFSAHLSEQMWKWETNDKQRLGVLLGLARLSVNCDFSRAPWWTDFYSKMHATAQVVESHGRAWVGKRLEGLAAASGAKSAIFDLFGANPHIKKISKEPGNTKNQIELSGSPQSTQAAHATVIYEPPLDGLCALTGARLADPVIGSGNFFYERQAILDWLSAGNLFCPVTGRPLQPEDLKEVDWGVEVVVQEHIHMEAQVPRRSSFLADLPPLHRRNNS